MKVPVQLVSHYSDIILFQKSLQAKEVYISNYLKELNNLMRGLINIQNDDNDCSRWCFVSYLNRVTKTQAKIRNADRHLAKQLNFKNVKFPAHKKDYAKIEKRNNISIKAFGFENKIYHIYTSKQTFEKYVDLLLISNNKNYYYVLIKDFNRFMANKTKHQGKKCFFNIATMLFFLIGIHYM